MQGTIDERVKVLEDRVPTLKSLLKFASRAFVIEFAGTPKSGKTTSIEAMKHFFARHGFRVHVLRERASFCPIPMKGHLFFNTWCAACMLAELLANVETETDIIIVDRGLFDALVWLTLQEKRSELTANEARTIESFLLLDRWRDLVDLAVVMNVSAEEAMRRENSQRLTQMDGSIMTRDVLAVITNCVELSVKTYGAKFRAIIDHATTDQGVRESLADLATRIMDALQEFLNPEILVVPRRLLSGLSLSSDGAFNKDALETALACIESCGRFMRRDEAEDAFDYVQIIPCGVLMHQKHVFLFTRKDTDIKSRLYGKTTVLQGCHVQKKDGSLIKDLLVNTLLERVARSLFLSRVFPIEPLGCCWDRDDDQSSRHFGVIYGIEIDNPNTAADFRKKEFRRQRGNGLTGEFLNWEQLHSDDVQQRLESWSRTIVRELGSPK